MFPRTSCAHGDEPILLFGNLIITRTLRRPLLVPASLVLWLWAAAGAVVAQTGADTADTPSWPLPDPAQVRLASPVDDLHRVAEITGGAPAGSRLVRRLSAQRAERSGFGLLPAQLVIVQNSGHPRGGNLGLLWAGRGASMLLGAGATFGWGPFSAAVAPEAAFQQNLEFRFRPAERPGWSSYAYPFSTAIDLPQRFGPNPFTVLGPGQSYARADVQGFAAGASTENLWWGPASRYPLLMSNNAPGFPHLFAGTSRPVSVGIGTLEVELVWGRLTESNYFDRIPEKHSFLGALVAAFSPALLPDLSLGAARVYQYLEDQWLAEPAPLLELFGGSGLNRPGNELFSIFGRWVFPESGAEIYGEWGRDDRWIDWKEVIQEPDHSQAYMLGFQKVTPLSERRSVRVQGELIALQPLSELRSGSRPLPVFYTHHQVRQGYTHRGQLMGAWIGPGSDAQFLAVDALVPWGTWGGYVERVRRSNASAAALHARRWSPYHHDTEMTMAARALFLPASDISTAATLSYGYRFNRDFLEDSRNIALEVSFSWAPAGVAW